jgi:hypothetical protein
MTCPGESLPKSISSIEKQTLLPIEETDDLYYGYSLWDCLSYFLTRGFE